ncbi:MAG: hypothetical protein WCX71_04310 [Candidatus Buchananbacteria bacterium]
MNKKYRIIQILLVLPLIFLALWAINTNFPRNGQMTVKLNFNQSEPMVSKLGPEGRVKVVDNQAIIYDHPVYFDLRSMPWFNRAQIKITYLPNGRQLDGMAGQVGAGWQYDLIKPLMTKDVGEGYLEANFVFDLDKVYDQKNVRRFLIASSPLAHSADNELKVKSIVIILNR